MFDNVPRTNSHCRLYIGMDLIALIRFDSNQIVVNTLTQTIVAFDKCQLLNTLLKELSFTLNWNLFTFKMI